MANSQNQALFAEINLYNCYFSSSCSNFENLFVTFDTSIGPGSNPPTSSLFDIDTFQNLVKLGTAAPNILNDPELVYGSDFVLTEDWTTLTDMLGLNTEMQTYFIWLWLDQAYNQTWTRTPVGGNLQVGLISNLAADSWQESVTTMLLEFPMFTYASQFNISFAANVTQGQTCTSFYETILQWPTTQSEALCSDPSGTFSFVNN